MPVVGLNREFLHRSCVQFSAPLSDASCVEGEKQHALRFVRLHAQDHVNEIARALIWRVVDTDDDDLADRAGAWSVLHAVLLECGDSKNDLSRTALADKLLTFLPYLISHRWYTTVVVAPAERPGGKLDTTAYGRVIPAALINGGEKMVTDGQTVLHYTRLYRNLLAGWKGVWRSDVYQSLKETARDAERNGNHLSEKAAKYLAVPATFKDSLWRLRRSSPRPSIALHVLYSYGWSPQTEYDGSNNIIRPKLLVMPRTMSEVTALDAAMHPGVKAWLSKLIECKGGCRLCDTWLHTEARCPCELPFVRTPSDESEGQRHFRGGPGSSNSGSSGAVAPGLPTTAVHFTYMEAVEKLFRYNIRLPLHVDQALDRITRLIQKEQPYEELLTAFDVVRGGVTGPVERHALWLHASYSLVPSRTVFDKPSDAALSPAMERAENHFKRCRRFREWDQLLQSVEALDGPFRRRELPQAAARCLEEIRETSSFFFCLVDGSLPSSFTPALYARVPEEVVTLAPLQHQLCHICLEPFHTAARCPRRASSEPWDLQVARLVLEDNSLISLNYTTELYKLQEALARIDADERRAKEFRKNELSLAVKLVHERQLPICSECNMVGHSTRFCEAHARRVLQREHINEIDMCLDQHEVQQVLRRYKEGQQDMEYKELRDAVEVLYRGSKTYPASYAAAIRELDDARVPLAAARYSTDAVQSFLLSINSSDLLKHLLPLRDEAFPEVCLFCDSYHHRSEDCSRARAEEQGFLGELRHCGLDLWRYLRKRDYYDELLPTDFVQGKESVLRLVRQFDEDYGPGGVARVKFIEHNGLDQTVAASQSSGFLIGAVPTLAAAMHNATASSQNSLAGAELQESLGSGGSQAAALLRASPYGCSFSQLIAPREENTQHRGSQLEETEKEHGLRFVRGKRPREPESTPGSQDEDGLDNITSNSNSHHTGKGTKGTAGAAEGRNGYTMHNMDTQLQAISPDTQDSYLLAGMLDGTAQGALRDDPTAPAATASDPPYEHRRSAVQDSVFSDRNGHAEAATSQDSEVNPFTRDEATAAPAEKRARMEVHEGVRDEAQGDAVVSPAASHSGLAAE